MLGTRSLPAYAVMLAGLVGGLVPSMARAGDASPPEPELAAARAAVKDLGERLRAELVAALNTGGPAAALGVCRTIAPAIADEASSAHGLDVGRTALRVRNPDNAPDAFERRVLEEFLRRIDAGSDPATLEHSEVVTRNGEATVRYMKAIPTAAEPCLACHGSAIEHGLQAEILRLYPDDAATGFSAGELRGAFTVSRRLGE